MDADKIQRSFYARLEADDMLGIKATRDKGCIIVSEDKDLKTIPAKVFNPAKDTEPHDISEQEADYNFMFQTLTGDKTDNYSGCPSVGPKTAEKILAVLKTSKTCGLLSQKPTQNKIYQLRLHYSKHK